MRVTFDAFSLNSYFGDFQFIVFFISVLFSTIL